MLGGSRDVEKAQLDDGILTRTKVKLMSASFLFMNEGSGMEIER